MKALIKEMKVMHSGEAEDCHIYMGGDSSDPTWKEYLDGFKLKYRPYIRGIRKALEEAGMVGTLAGDHCNDTWFQSCDGNFAISFTWRAWGDLMQAIVGKREGYMRYYM